MSHGLRHIVDDLLGFQNVHDVERPDAEGNRPLHLACLGGQLHIVKALVSEDVQLDSVNDRGETPLLVALLHGQTDCAMFLLEKGDRPTSIPPRAQAGSSPPAKSGTKLPGACGPGQAPTRRRRTGSASARCTSPPGAAWPRWRARC